MVHGQTYVESSVTSRLVIIITFVENMGGSVAWSEYPVHPDFNVIICTGGDTIIGACNSFSGSQRE